MNKRVMEEFIASTPRLRTGVAHLARNEAALDDIMQEAALRVVKSSDTFRGDSTVYTWLYRLTRNAALNYIRKERLSYRDAYSISVEDTDDAGLIPPDVCSPEEIALAGDAHGEFIHAYNKIPGRMRIIFDLRGEGLSYVEIADKLGIAVGTVRSSLFRARQRLNFPG